MVCSNQEGSYVIIVTQSAIGQLRTFNVCSDDQVTHTTAFEELILLLSP